MCPLKIGTFFAYSTKPSTLRGVKDSPVNSLNLTNLIFMLTCIPVSSDLAQLSPLTFSISRLSPLQVSGSCHLLSPSHILFSSPVRDSPSIPLPLILFLLSSQGLLLVLLKLTRWEPTF